MPSPPSLNQTTLRTALAFLDRPGRRKAMWGTSLRVNQRAFVFESRIIQKCADSTIDPLLLPLADYASFVEAVSLHGHQSGRRPVIDRKDCFPCQCALHGCITTQLHAQFPGGRKQCPFRPRPVAPKALAPCRSAAAWGCWWERIRRASSRVSKSRKIGGSSYGKLASCRPALPGALVATVL
jgi:hypothetical protein